MNMRARVSSALYRLSPSLKFWCGRILFKVGAAKWITFPQNGYTLRLCRGTEHRWLQPVDSPRPVEGFFRRYLKEGDVVIDAGANVGIFSMVAAMMVGPTGEVYSIEPHPKTFEYLRLHIADNQASHVKVFQLALGDRSGSVNFSDNTDNDDLNHIVAEEAGGITVPMRRLDDLLIANSVDLLKIDVEGYELIVLESAASLLPRVRCVLFEVEDEKCRRFGRGALELLSFVRSQGFRLLRIVGDSAADALVESIPNQSEDLVAVRDLNDFLQRTGYKWEPVPRNTPSLRMQRK